MLHSGFVFAFCRRVARVDASREGRERSRVV